MRAVDDRRGRVERALRVRGLERERVVDDERRPGARGARVAASAAAAHASAASATSGTTSRHLRKRGTTHVDSLLDSRGAFQTYSTSPREAARLGAAAAAAAPGGCSQQARRAAAGERQRAAAPRPRQRSNAYGQRGWKRQPLGGCAGSGTSPGSASGRTPAPSACGTAAISASVYGMQRRAPRAAPSGRSRPSGRGTSPRRRRRRGGRSRGRARSAAARASSSRERLHEQVRELRLRRRVERRERLVEHDHRRVGGERAGDRDPLALPARELVRVARRPRSAGRPTSSSSSRTRASRARRRRRAHRRRRAGCRPCGAG